ncbi:hypothetical protein BDF14DRAFT_1733922 [Spinellus fusiger]|nr:hypothetical protein BDF14DRAFT_1733922 [Spinellus fusiger]
MDATACRKLGNAYTVCVPSYVDTWENGTAHNFIWNYEQPFYVSSPTISLYLYYKQNFAYNLIKNWTDMSTSSGELDVVVDDTWFPMTLPAGSGNQTLTLFGFFLPSNLNATYELTSTTSSYPRPFNFTVLRKYRRMETNSIR